MNLIKLKRKRIMFRLITFTVIASFLCHDIAWAGGEVISKSKRAHLLAPESSFSESSGELGLMTKCLRKAGRLRRGGRNYTARRIIAMPSDRSRATNEEILVNLRNQLNLDQKEMEQLLSEKTVTGREMLAVYEQGRGVAVEDIISASYKVWRERIGGVIKLKREQLGLGYKDMEEAIRGKAEIGEGQIALIEEGKIIPGGRLVEAVDNIWKENITNAIKEKKTHLNITLDELSELLKEKGIKIKKMQLDKILLGKTKYFNKKVIEGINRIWAERMGWILRKKREQISMNYNDIVNLREVRRKAKITPEQLFDIEQGKIIPCHELIRSIFKVWKERIGRVLARKLKQADLLYKDVGRELMQDSKVGVQRVSHYIRGTDNPSDEFIEKVNDLWEGRIGGILRKRINQLGMKYEDVINAVSGEIKVSIENLSDIEGCEDSLKYKLAAAILKMWRKKIGGVLIRKRNHIGLTAEDMALLIKEDCEISSDVLYGIERGTLVPKDSLIAAIDNRMQRIGKFLKHKREGQGISPEDVVSGLAGGKSRISSDELLRIENSELMPDNQLVREIYDVLIRPRGRVPKDETLSRMKKAKEFLERYPKIKDALENDSERGERVKLILKYRIFIADEKDRIVHEKIGKMCKNRTYTRQDIQYLENWIMDIVESFNDFKDDMGIRRDRYLREFLTSDYKYLTPEEEEELLRRIAGENNYDINRILDFLKNKYNTKWLWKKVVEKRLRKYGIIENKNKPPTHSKAPKGAEPLTEKGRRELERINKDADYFMLSEKHPKLFKDIKESILEKYNVGGKDIKIDKDKLKDIKVIRGNSPALSAENFGFNVNGRIGFAYYELGRNGEVTVVLTFMFFTFIMDEYMEIEERIVDKQGAFQKYRNSGGRDAVTLKDIEEQIKEMTWRLEIPIAKLRQLALHELVEATEPKIDQHEEAEAVEVIDTVLLEKRFKERYEVAGLEYPYEEFLKKDKKEGILMSLLDQGIEKSYFEIKRRRRYDSEKLSAGYSDVKVEFSESELESAKVFLREHPDIREELENHPFKGSKIKHILKDESLKFKVFSRFGKGTTKQVIREKIRKVEKWILDVVKTYGGAKKPFDETFPARKEAYFKNFMSARYGYLFPEERIKALEELAKDNDILKITGYLISKYNATGVSWYSVKRRLVKYGIIKVQGREDYMAMFKGGAEVPKTVSRVKNAMLFLEKYPEVKEELEQHPIRGPAVKYILEHRLLKLDKSLADVGEMTGKNFNREFVRLIQEWILDVVETFGGAKEPFDETFPERKKAYLGEFRRAEYGGYIFPSEKEKVLRDLVVDNDYDIERIVEYLRKCGARRVNMNSIRKRLAEYGLVVKTKYYSSLQSMDGGISEELRQEQAGLNRAAGYFMLSKAEPVLFRAIKSSIRDEYCVGKGEGDKEEFIKINKEKLNDIKVIYGNSPALSFVNFGFEADGKIAFADYELDPETKKVTVVLPFMFFAAIMKDYLDIKDFIDNTRNNIKRDEKDSKNTDSLKKWRKEVKEKAWETELFIAKLRQAVLREMVKAEYGIKDMNQKTVAVEYADTALLEERLRKRYEKIGWQYPYVELLKKTKEGVPISLLDQEIEELCPVKIDKEDIVKLWEECGWNIVRFFKKLGIGGMDRSYFNMRMDIKTQAELILIVIRGLGLEDVFKRKIMEVFKDKELKWNGDPDGAANEFLSRLSNMFMLYSEVMFEILLKLNIKPVVISMFGTSREELLNKLANFHNYSIPWLYDKFNEKLENLGFVNLGYEGVIEVLDLVEVYRDILSKVYLQKEGNWQRICEEFKIKKWIHGISRYGYNSLSNRSEATAIKDVLYITFNREKLMLERGMKEEEVDRYFDDYMKKRNYDLGLIKESLHLDFSTPSHSGQTVIIETFRLQKLLERIILRLWIKNSFRNNYTAQSIGTTKVYLPPVMAVCGIKDLSVYIGVDRIGHLKEKLAIIRREKIEGMVPDIAKVEKEITELIDKTALDKYIRLFGIKGAYKYIFIKFRDRLGRKELFDITRKYLEGLDLGDVEKGYLKTGKEFSFDEARGIELPETMDRTELDDLTDDVIAVIYKNLIKNPRYLEEIKQESQNEENGGQWKDVYRRVYEHYKGAVDFEIKGLRPNVILRLFQRTGIKFLVEKKKVVLADDMGTGKTIEAIAAALNIPNEDGTKGAKKVLIISPNSAKDVWEKEIRSKTREKFVVIGPGKLQKERFFKEAEEAKFLIVNYEAVGRRDRAVLDRLLKFKFDVIIYDEAHKLRNENLYWKAIKGLNAPYEFALTGTPLVGRKIGKAFNVAHKLYPERFPSRKGFNMKYSYRKKKGFYTDEAYERARQYYNDVRDFTLRRLKKDVLPNLPPKRPPINVPVRLRPEHRKVYDRIYRDFKAWLAEYVSKEKRPAKPIILSKYLRLKQAAIDPALVEENIFLIPRGEGKEKECIIRPDLECVKIKERIYTITRDEEGVFTLTAGRSGIKIRPDTKEVTIDDMVYDVNVVTRDIPSAKYEELDKLIDMIIGRGEKVLVYSTYVDVVDKLRNMEKYKELGACYLKGGMTNKARAKQIDMFQEDPDKKIMFSTFTESITLTAPNNVIFIDKPWTPEQRDQAVDRTHRFGQTRPVNTYSLVAEDTVDENVEKILTEGDILFKWAVERFGELSEIEDEAIEAFIRDEKEAKNIMNYLKDRYADYEKIEEARKEKAEPFTRMADKESDIYIEVQDGNRLAAYLDKEDGGKINIEGFGGFLKTADSLSAGSKKLIKEFFKKRMDYEIGAGLNMKESFLWPLFSELVPIVAQIDFHGQLEFEVELAMFVIYSLLGNEDKGANELLVSGIRKDLNINKVLYMLDRYNIFRALSKMGVLSSSFYCRGKLLDYYHPSQLFSVEGAEQGLYRDREMVEAIVPDRIDKEKMIENRQVNIFRREASKYRKLTREEEIRLCREAAKGNLVARDAIISANFSLIIRIAESAYWGAKKKARKLINQVEIVELFAEGNRELVNILADYVKVYKDKSFEEYGRTSIRKKLTKYIWDKIKELGEQTAILDVPRYAEGRQTTLKDELAGDIGRGVEEEQEAKSELIRLAKEILYKRGFSLKEIKIFIESAMGDSAEDISKEFEVTIEKVKGVIQKAGDVLKNAPEFIKAARLPAKPRPEPGRIVVEKNYGDLKDENEEPAHSEAPGSEGKNSLGAAVAGFDGKKGDEYQMTKTDPLTGDKIIYDAEGKVLEVRSGEIPDILPPHRNPLDMDAFNLPSEKFGVKGVNIVREIDNICAQNLEGARYFIRVYGSSVYLAEDGKVRWDNAGDLDLEIYIEGDPIDKENSLIDAVRTKISELLLNKYGVEDWGGGPWGQKSMPICFKKILRVDYQIESFKAFTYDPYSCYFSNGKGETFKDRGDLRESEKAVSFLAERYQSMYSSSEIINGKGIQITLKKLRRYIFLAHITGRFNLKAKLMDLYNKIDSAIRDKKSGDLNRDEIKNKMLKFKRAIMIKDKEKIKRRIREGLKRTLGGQIDDLYENIRMAYNEVFGSGFEPSDRSLNEITWWILWGGIADFRALKMRLTVAREDLLNGKEPLDMHAEEINRMTKFLKDLFTSTIGSLNLEQGLKKFLEDKVLVEIRGLEKKVMFLPAEDDSHAGCYNGFIDKIVLFYHPDEIGRADFIEIIFHEMIESMFQNYFPRNYNDSVFYEGIVHYLTNIAVDKYMEEVGFYGGFLDRIYLQHYADEVGAMEWLIEKVGLEPIIHALITGNFNFLYEETKTIEKKDIPDRDVNLRLLGEIEYLGKRMVPLDEAYKEFKDYLDGNEKGMPAPKFFNLAHGKAELNREEMQRFLQEINGEKGKDWKEQNILAERLRDGSLLLRKVISNKPKSPGAAGALPPESSGAEGALPPESSGASGTLPPKSLGAAAAGFDRKEDDGSYQMMKIDPVTGKMIIYDASGEIKAVMDLEYAFSEEMTRRADLLQKNIDRFRNTPYGRVGIKLNFLEVPLSDNEMPMMTVISKRGLEVRLLINKEMVEIFGYHDIKGVVVDKNCPLSLVHIIAYLGALRNLKVKLGDKESFAQKDNAYYIRSGGEIKVSTTPPESVVREWKVNYIEQGLSSFEKSALNKINEAKEYLYRGDIAKAKLALETLEKEIKKVNIRPELLVQYKTLAGAVNSAFYKIMDEISRLTQKGRHGDAVDLLASIYDGFKDNDDFIKVLDSLEGYLPEIFKIRIGFGRARTEGKRFQDILLESGYDSPLKFLKDAKEKGNEEEARDLLRKAIIEAYYEGFGGIVRAAKMLGFSRPVFARLVKELSVNLNDINLNAIDRLRSKVEDVKKRYKERILSRTVKELGFRDFLRFSIRFWREKGFRELIKGLIEGAVNLKGKYKIFICDYLGISMAYLDKIVKEYNINLDNIKHGEGRRLQEVIARQCAKKEGQYNFKEIITKMGYPDIDTFMKIYKSDQEVMDVIKQFLIKVLQEFGGNIPYCIKITNIQGNLFRDLISSFKIGELKYNEADRLREVLAQMKMDEMGTKGPLKMIKVGDIECFNLNTALESMGWPNLRRFIEKHGDDNKVRKVLKKAFEEALEMANGNKLVAERLLGVGTSTFHRWWKRLGISIEEVGKDTPGIADRFKQALLGLPMGKRERLDLAGEFLGFGHGKGSFRAFMVKHGNDPRLRNVLKDIITHVLIEQGGHLAPTVKRLGITLQGLLNFMRELKIDKDSLPYNELGRFKKACEGYKGEVPDISKAVKSLGYHNFNIFMRHNRSIEGAIIEYINSLIKKTLVIAGGNMKETARRLGISTQFFYGLHKNKIPDTPGALKDIGPELDKKAIDMFTIAETDPVTGNKIIYDSKGRVREVQDKYGNLIEKDFYDKEGNLIEVALVNIRNGRDRIRLGVDIDRRDKGDFIKLEVLAINGEELKFVNKDLVLFSLKKDGCIDMEWVYPFAYRIKDEYEKFIGKGYGGTIFNWMAWYIKRHYKDRSDLKFNITSTKNPAVLNLCLKYFIQSSAGVGEEIADGKTNVRPVSITVEPDGRVIQYQNGRLIEIRYPDGKRKIFSYNERDELVSIIMLNSEGEEIMFMKYPDILGGEGYTEGAVLPPHRNPLDLEDFDMPGDKFGVRFKGLNIVREIDKACEEVFGAGKYFIKVYGRSVYMAKDGIVNRDEILDLDLDIYIEDSLYSHNYLYSLYEKIKKHLLPLKPDMTLFSQYMKFQEIPLLVNFKIKTFKKFEYDPYSCYFANEKCKTFEEQDGPRQAEKRISFLVRSYKSAVYSGINKAKIIEIIERCDELFLSKILRRYIFGAQITGRDDLKNEIMGFYYKIRTETKKSGIKGLDMEYVKGRISEFTSKLEVENDEDLRKMIEDGLRQNLDRVIECDVIVGGEKIDDGGRYIMRYPPELIEATKIADEAGFVLYVIGGFVRRGFHGERRLNWGKDIDLHLEHPSGKLMPGDFRGKIRSCFKKVKTVDFLSLRDLLLGGVTIYKVRFRLELSKGRPERGLLIADNEKEWSDFANNRIYYDTTKLSRAVTGKTKVPDKESIARIIEMLLESETRAIDSGVCDSLGEEYKLSQEFIQLLKNHPDIPNYVFYEKVINCLFTQAKGAEKPEQKKFALELLILLVNFIKYKYEEIFNTAKEITLSKEQNLEIRLEAMKLALCAVYEMKGEEGLNSFIYEILDGNEDIVIKMMSYCLSFHTTDEGFALFLEWMIKSKNKKVVVSLGEELQKYIDKGMANNERIKELVMKLASADDSDKQKIGLSMLSKMGIENCVIPSEPKSLGAAAAGFGEKNGGNDDLRLMRQIDNSA